MKIAISLSGRIQTLLEVIPSLNEKLLSLYDCDIYILVNTIDRNFKQRPKNTKYASRGLPEYDNNVESKIKNILGDKLKYLNITNSEFSEGLPKSRFPKKTLGWEASKIQRVEQFYKVYLLNEEIKKYQHKNNFTYDYIIRTRSDLEINFNLDVNQFVKNTLYLFGCDFQYESEKYKYTWDGFAIGDNDVMETYSSLCFNLGNYTKNKELLYCEAQLWQYLVDKNVNIKFLPKTDIKLFKRATQDNGKLNHDVFYGRFSWIVRPPTFKPIEVSDKYKFFSDDYSEQISSYFDENINCIPFCKDHNINDKLFIKKIDCLDFCLDGLRKIYSDYSEYKLFKAEIIRHYSMNVPTSRGSITLANNNEPDKWNSELWHVDGYSDGVDSFKIIIYLSDVTKEKEGGFEYFTPIRFSDKLRNRFEYNEYGKQVFGKKGTTIIFYPYMIHKGNYTKLGYRDSLNLSFCLNDKNLSKLNQPKQNLQFDTVSGKVIQKKKKLKNQKIFENRQKCIDYYDNLLQI